MPTTRAFPAVCSGWARHDGPAYPASTVAQSGRFDAAPNADVFAWGASFGFDRRLFEDDVVGSLAWAEALAAMSRVARHRAVHQALGDLNQRIHALALDIG